MEADVGTPACALCNNCSRPGYAARPYSGVHERPCRYPRHADSAHHQPAGQGHPPFVTLVLMLNRLLTLNAEMAVGALHRAPGDNGGNGCRAGGPGPQNRSSRQQGMAGAGVAEASAALYSSGQSPVISSSCSTRAACDNPATPLSSRAWHRLLTLSYAQPGGMIRLQGAQPGRTPGAMGLVIFPLAADHLVAAVGMAAAHLKPGAMLFMQLLIFQQTGPVTALHLPGTGILLLAAVADMTFYLRHRARPLTLGHRSALHLVCVLPDWH